MSIPAPQWTIDPDDPRAPPAEIWERLTAEERRAIIEALPSEFPPSEACPPEGDDHCDAFYGARDALRRWFSGRGQRIYIAGNLPVYYPGESMFSPDVIAVVGAEQHQRSSWIVSSEGGKGLDVAMEIVIRGDRKKDLQRNVERYARLGIPEYYLFDRRHMTLSAWELEGAHSYRRRMPQRGRFASSALGLELWLDAERLRFSIGDAPVPYADELIDRITRLSGEAQGRATLLEEALQEAHRLLEEEHRVREEEQQRREEEQQRREAEERLRKEEQQRREAEERLRKEEQQRREEEQQRREAAEAELVRLRAELAALRRSE